MRPARTTHVQPSPRHLWLRRRAFTLIELMVVIGIIAILIGLLGVAFSGALGSSRNAATSSLMQNIQTGLQQFETDFGYLPPLIDGHKHAIDAIDDPNVFASELRDHRYHSVYTLPLYLLGIGEIAPYDSSIQPGDDPDRYDGKQGPGFRDPGPDHAWGGARDRSNHKPKRTGRVYGPYIDIGDGEDILRRSVPDDFAVPNSAVLRDFFADGNVNGNGADQVGDLFVLEDRWGQAIRYYKLWPTREKVGAAILPSLDLVPFELRTVDSINQAVFRPGQDVRADPLVDPDLIRASYALLSAGADTDFGDTDADGQWLDDSILFNSADEIIIAISKRVGDNIRTTP